MATAHAAPEPVIDDIWEEVDNFKKRGNWTEDRHEILKNLTWEDIEADADRLEAENPGRYLTPEELNAKIKQIEAERTAERTAEHPATHRAELVGA